MIRQAVRQTNHVKDKQSKSSVIVFSVMKHNNIRFL